jgi:hypothetical protein
MALGFKFSMACATDARMPARSLWPRSSVGTSVEM